MVQFFDRRLLASMEKLLYLVMNLPICGWSKEPTLKMEALCAPKPQPTVLFYTPKHGNLHSHPCYFLCVSLEFVYSKSIALP